MGKRKGEYIRERELLTIAHVFLCRDPRVVRKPGNAYQARIDEAVRRDQGNALDSLQEYDLLIRAFASPLIQMTKTDVARWMPWQQRRAIHFLARGVPLSKLAATIGMWITEREALDCLLALQRSGLIHFAPHGILIREGDQWVACDGERREVPRDTQHQLSAELVHDG